MSERVRVAVLGSTGSIGRQALDVLAARDDRFEVVALAAGKNEALLQEQTERFKPRLKAIAEDGPSALVDIATDAEVDMVVVGTSGVVSLEPVIAAHVTAAVWAPRPLCQPATADVSLRR